jgi:hypothetical protein
MRARRLTLLIFLAATLGIIAAPPAAAEAIRRPPVMVDNEVARADLVVRGKVVIAGEQMRIEVFETFKGPAFDHVDLAAEPNFHVENGVRGREVIAFASKRSDGTWLGPSWTHPLIDVELRRFDVLDIHLDYLRDRESVLAAVRTAAAAYPGPASAGPGTLRTGWVAVPDDARTEAAAARAALATEGDGSARFLALMVLRARKTASARATLRALLDDTTVQEPVGESKWRRGPQWVRFLADYALSGREDPKAEWLLGMEKFEGPALAYRPVRVVTGRRLLVAVGLVVALAVAAAFRRVRSFVPRPFSCGVVVSLALTVALGALWHRSYRSTDELTLRRGTLHHEFAARRGRFVYTLVREWITPDPPAADWQHSDRLHIGHFPDAPDLWTPNAAPAWSRLGLSKTSGTIAGPFRGTHPYTTVHIPMWLPMLLLLIPPARTMTARVRAIRRRRAGRCPACGYDLRATPGRCPECGPT